MLSKFHSQYLPFCSGNMNHALFQLGSFEGPLVSFWKTLDAVHQILPSCHSGPCTNVILSFWNFLCFPKWPVSPNCLVLTHPLFIAVNPLCLPRGGARSGGLAGGIDLFTNNSRSQDWWLPIPGHTHQPPPDSQALARGSRGESNLISQAPPLI